MLLFFSALLQPLEMVGVGMPRLLQLAGRLLTDNTPEAREAAKRMVLLLSAAFADEAMQLQLDVQVQRAGESVAWVGCSASHSPYNIIDRRSGSSSTTSNAASWVTSSV